MENFIKLLSYRFNVRHIERYRPDNVNWAGISGWYIKIKTITGECDIEFDTENDRDYGISRLDGYFKITPL